MKKTNIKVFLTILTTFITLGTPLNVCAESTIKNSIGSINNKDDGISVGIDITQGKRTTYSEEITTDTIESTFVYVSQASTFNVIIPKTITLDEETKMGEYEILVNGNIGSDEKINVVPNNEFSMSQKGKKNINAKILQDKMSWSHKDFQTKANGNIVANDMTAGTWNGSFNFKIELSTNSYIQK